MRPQAIRPDGFGWYDRLPASPAVRAGDLVFVAGQVDADASGAIRSPGDAVAQAHGAFAELERVLEACGGGLADVVDVMSFHSDIRDAPAVLETARGRLGPDFPAWTPVGMSGSYDPDALVVIRAIAHLGGGPKRCVTPDGAAWMSAYPVSAACGRGISCSSPASRDWTGPASRSRRGTTRRARGSRTSAPPSASRRPARRWTT